MLFSCIESSKYLHLVYNLSVLLRLFALELLYLFQVKQTALNYELFATNSLIKPAIVQLYNAVFEFYVLRCVIFKEFHVSEEQLRIHVILLLEVTALRQIAQHFVAVLLRELIGDIRLRTLLLLDRGFLNHRGADDVGVENLLLCRHLLLA